MSRNMRQDRPLVCLVDSRDDGHHPMYAAVYAQAVRELGCDVWLAAPTLMIAAMPPAHGRGDAVGSLTMTPWMPPARFAADGGRPEGHASRLWGALGAAVDEASRVSGRYPDFLLHLYFDDFISEVLPRRAVETRIRCPFAGLWFKPPPSRPPTWREAAKRVLRAGRRYPVLRSPRCAGILLLDASDSRHLARGGRPTIVEVPEVSESALPPTEPVLVTDIRRRAAGRSIFSVVGSIEGRKGLRDFLRAAEVAPVDEWYFVIAGRLVRDNLDDDTAARLERLTSGQKPPVLLIDRWLDDETLNAIVAQSNLMHVYYYDWPYSSNMLCKTAAYGVPAIGGTAGYIGRMIREYDLGTTLPPESPPASLFLPGFAAKVAAFSRSDGFRNGCRRYLDANNATALRAAITRLLRDHVR